ncbi:hypothetical protein QBC36DRAFT_343475 [Triangularia setosa]|uniref:Aminoglycoside phosphotransferase domain-containing protein n=1 Tax=Triangularia setosa TaxID=2587417 RepID=A0AAN6WDX2_9PEZI|nr:hypothetical protein QBC36DRAFT_343475 [Podospora setosa]
MQEDNKAAQKKTSFFARNNFPESTESLCFGTALARFPSSMLIEPTSQGYCSYTLLNTSQQLAIQFRPEKHAIDVEISELAREIHGSWAPVTKLLGCVSLSPRLDFYSHSLIPGKVLSNFPFENGGVNAAELVHELAVFSSQAYHHPSSGASRKLGRIGSGLEGRLLLLREGLPVRFRGLVNCVLLRLEEIVGLPWVLTHGDFNPDNIIVKLDKSKRELKLKGVIDWAEAEFLPFGTGLYGLESILRYLGGSVPSDGPGVEVRVKLREIFWSELEKQIPKLKTDEEFRERVKLAGLMGVLFWYGIAFDNGALDRVVENGRDDKEVRMLGDILFEAGGWENYAGLVEDSKK